MDVPGHAEPFIITDAAVNIFPTFADKVDILRNAIDLAHVLGFPEVRVAILSAVEMINPKIPSTMEAAALCKMADRGQITGAILMGRWRLTTPSAWKPRRSSTWRRRWPVGRTSFWCQTSKQATCSRRA